MADNDTIQNPPSLADDPANLEGGLTGMLRFVLKKFAMNELDGCIPVRVTATDGRDYATVLPMVQLVDTGGVRVSRASIARVPIFQIGAGGFVLSFPVVAGDLGWLIAADRDIQGYLSSLTEQPPQSKRFHDFRDGIFFPDSARRFAVSAPDGAVSIEMQGGAIQLYLSPDKIEIKHPITVQIDAPDVQVNGNITASGTIRAGQVIQGNIELGTHLHSGVTSGGANTGLPTT